MDLEIKNLLEKGNTEIAALRSAVETKADAGTIARIEATLAETLSTKSALVARLDAMETAQARNNLMGKTTAEVDEHKSAFVAFLRNPMDNGLKAKAIELAGKSVNLASPAAGQMAVPLQIASDVAAVALNISPMRGLARVVQVGSSEYREILDNSNAGFEWVGDADTRATTTSPTMTEVKPTFGEISAVAEISMGALEDIFFDASAWLVDSLSRKFAEAEGAAFINGNGTNKPTGLLNGSVISTVKTGNAATLGATPLDTLIDMIYSLKGAYAQNGSFLMNSLTLAALTKVKDSNGNYLFDTVNNTIIRKPVFVDENMPSVAANAKPIIFGDFNRGYVIADRTQIDILLNPYKTSGYLTVQARKKVGGIVKDASALKALVVSV